MLQVRRVVAAAMLTLALVIPSGIAHAWSWDPNVTLTGNVACGNSWNSLRDHVKGVNLWSPISGNRYLSVSGTGAVAYRTHYSNVPFSGTYVNYRIDCRYTGPRYGQVSLKRPLSGTTLTRNLR